MEVMEFFTNADEVWYADREGVKPLREGDDMVGLMADHIRNLYPRAYERLAECYKKSAKNVPYFTYLVVRRFCKCNFGALDYTKNDIDRETFNLERVPCPLRGECPHEGVICSPEPNTKLSEAEKRVMRLVCEGKSNAEIADELYLSPNTVKRHISTAFIKVGVRNRAEFVQYAIKNNLFY